MRTGEVGIRGSVTEVISGDPIADAEVKWWCLTCASFIGDDVVDDIGWYDIDPEDPFNWEEHDGHHMEGKAMHPAYNTGTREIPNFDSGLIPYRIDFELVPGK